MGSDVHYPEEAPAHAVTVDGFWMDETTVTNAEFRRFVEATGHVTSAERPANPDDYPGREARDAGARPRSCSGAPRTGSICPITSSGGPTSRARAGGTPGDRTAQSTALDEHPVVHVNFDDAAAYCAWAGKALPTEAEWERAARGGLEGAEYAWGAELTPDGKHMANTWQGEFPMENRLTDGFEWTAPVRSFPPNGYGLYEMAGNVWEWTVDYYEARHRVPGGCCGPAKNPRGGVAEKSLDPALPGLSIPRKVTKGGSFLCAPNYCRRYRPAARMAQAVDTSTCHLGFRAIVRG